MKKQSTEKRKRAGSAIQIGRYEAKYIIPKSLVPGIREFIRPFCEPDPYCKGDPPEYVVTTLQLDSPNLVLHHAKENEALNRFKLRVRTYDEPGESAVFMEVKRKIGGTVVKSRCSVPFKAWGEHLIYDLMVNLTFKSRKEEQGFLEFVRLVREIGAQPVLLMCYTRESYFSKIDQYARVSFDRQLFYQPTTSWDSWGRDGRWLSMDSSLAQNKQYSFSGVVLELKSLSDVPRWMIDLVMEFELVRTGNCKYSTAVWLESLIRGTPTLPVYAVEMMTF